MYHVTMKKGYNFLKVKLYTLHRKKINLKKKICRGGGGGEEGADHRFVESGPSV